MFAAALRRVSSQLASTSARALQLVPEAGPSAAQARCFSASSSGRGIDEFFGEKYLAGSVQKDYPRAGRSWEAEELRTKSDEDLHKLWYVLLKEKNLLFTERLAARSQRERFLNPFRLRKVKQSMARVKTVLNERVRALAADPVQLQEYKVDLRSRLMPGAAAAAFKPSKAAAGAGADV